MSTPQAKHEFLLLFRNTQLEKRLAKDEMREAMRRLNDWLMRGSEQGLIRSGQPLANDGHVISGSGQRTVTDGPFAEAKEAVGGYVLVQAASLPEAIALAEEWPLLDYDATVEVRPILTRCASMAAVEMELPVLGASV